MTHRFYVHEAIPNDGMFILKNEHIAHQLARVLKIREGEEVIFFNGDGTDRVMRISKISQKFVSGRITECRRAERDPVLEVHLFQAVIKKDNMEWVLEKATEIGVKFFHPVLSRRSVKTAINPERARRIVIEATEQSGQGIVPIIGEVVPFSDALQNMGADAHTFLFDPSGDASVPLEKRAGRVNVFIGPEGGFTQDELVEARGRNIPIISLGRRIFRAETAAIVAVARILDGNQCSW